MKDPYDIDHEVLFHRELTDEEIERFKREYQGQWTRMNPWKPLEIKRSIVCLCGSTRFMEQFHEMNRKLSLEGSIVLSVEIVTYNGATDPQRANPQQKAELDDLHLDKIALADEVVIINVNDYVGESTWNELAWARKLGKRVRWMYPSVHALNYEQVVE